MQANLHASSETINPNFLFIYVCIKHIDYVSGWHFRESLQPDRCDNAFTFNLSIIEALFVTSESGLIAGGEFLAIVSFKQ